MLKTFQTEQTSCRGGFFEEIKAIGVENCTKFRPKSTNIQKKSNFENFMQFLCNFGKPWRLRTPKKFNKEQIDCQEGFFRKKNEVL